MPLRPSTKGFIAYSLFKARLKSRMCRLIICCAKFLTRPHIGMKICSFVFRLFQFQQFAEGRGKPLKRLKHRHASTYRAKAAVLRRACRSACEISGFSGFDRAFTLIELLVLIGTVGLLFSVLV